MESSQRSWRHMASLGSKELTEPFSRYNESVVLIQLSQVLDLEIPGLWSTQLGKALSYGHE